MYQPPLLTCNYGRDAFSGDGACVTKRVRRDGLVADRVAGAPQQKNFWLDPAEDAS